MDDLTFMFIGQQKGRSTKEKIYHNFGMTRPEGYRKALRLMKMAEKFSLPVITFIDTPDSILFYDLTPLIHFGYHSAYAVSMSYY